MNTFTPKVLLKLAFLLIIAVPLNSIAMDGGGGGGGGFTDGLPGGSSGCGSQSVSNKGASVATPCHPDNVDAKYCPAKGETNYYADCMYSTGGTCKFDICACWGSQENTVYSTFCAPATGTFVFEVSNVSCSGGASSLQFQVMEGTTSTSICLLNAVYCNKGFTGNINMSASLTSGQCYTLMFDGNAGAECTWDFNINCTYALGVVMLDYKAKLDNDGKSIFSWEVTQENEVSHYIVERSTDGNNFTELERVLPINDPDKRLAYQVIDKNPASGNNYYRLKQIDVDKTEYTYKRLAVMKRALDVQIYPNPIKEDLNISFGKDLAAGTEIAVYDILGNLVYKNQLSERTSSHRIDMNECTKGIYFLSIKSDDVVLQQKFFKD
jgi:hypothetical protein